MSGAPIDRALIRARQDRARRGGDVPARTRDARSRSTARRRRRAVRGGGRSRHTHRRPAPRTRQQSGHRVADRGIIERAERRSCIVANDEGCPSPTPASISWYRQWALQTVNDLPGTLVQIRRALKPDGLLLAALLGGDTLHRAKKLCRRVGDRRRGFAARCSVCGRTRDRSAAETCGVALPVADVDFRATVRYASVSLHARPAPDGGNQRTSAHTVAACDACENGRKISGIFLIRMQAARDL